ncbi:MAG: hypothetical protein EP297_13740 [Gammaproteobacteria bacterium]|nr:MAG: hypothetical protein EP297_13740 [Gammaproteobacteria bacterium]
MSEVIFWKTVAWFLGLFIVVSLLINSFTGFNVPPQVTSLMLGSLFCIGVGYSVVCPDSSPIRLNDAEENVFRNKQYVIGLLVSFVIVLLFLHPEVRRFPSSWLLVPFILLGPFLIFREAILKIRDKRKSRYS